MGDGEATGSRRLAGKSPLKYTKYKTCESKNMWTQTVETDEDSEQNSSTQAEVSIINI